MLQDAAMTTDPLETGPHRQQAVREMFDRIAPRYARMNSLMTFGLDRRWRRQAVTELQADPGSLVVDVACGPGELCRELERVGHRAIGFDISEGMLRASAGGTLRVLGDALRLPLRDGSADGATCGFGLRNVSDLDALFAELGRVLRPGGRIAVLEVSEPTRQPAHFVHQVYFRHVVPFVGGLLSDRLAYSYLPESSALLPPDEALERMVRASGFDTFHREKLGLGATQLITATRRG